MVGSSFKFVLILKNLHDHFPFSLLSGFQDVTRVVLVSKVLVAFSLPVLPHYLMLISSSVFADPYVCV